MTPVDQHQGARGRGRFDTRSALRRLVLAAGGAACVLVVCACGGGSGGGGGGSLDVRPVWPQPDGGQTSVQLPAAVQTVRVVFDSDAGLHCCIAINPATVPIDALTGLRLLLLDTLPPGPATFTLSAFAADFAPAPDGITEICPTDPPGVGQACDATRPATPNFQSQPQAVIIAAGTRTQSVDIGLVALPFVFDLQPAPGDSATSPVPISFTAADAVSGVDRGSIAVEASFRSLSKRVRLTFSPCDDMTNSPCSQHGQLQVTGFRVVGTPPFLPPGPASLRITGRNLASPPAELDFSYDFTVLAQSPAGTAGADRLTPSPDHPSLTTGDPANTPATASAVPGEDVTTNTVAPASSPIPIPTRAATSTRVQLPMPTETSTPAAAQTPEGTS